MEDSLNRLYETTVLKNNFNNINLFKILSLNKSEKKKIKRKQKINNDNKHLYYINSGKIMTKRNDVIISIHQEGEFVGLNALLDEENTKDEFIVVEDGLVCEFESMEALFTLLSLQEGWIYLLVQEKLRCERLIQNSICIHKNGKEKIKKIFVYLAREFGTATEKGMLLPTSFNRSLIAEYSNVTLKSLKKIIELLALEEWLEINGQKIYIKYDSIQSYV
ncbi:Crp/Fnr family transcriptional regulator [Listeria booriae]|uniref:Crp/Fnr family transcriptional regulator n=1 Tax=Listeria booriae TaxID=1552123 RepID=A0A842EX91_9LIST|nr:Crp/Fnr family transcriptional regulator [Listeria booriae]MBC2242717.1 Crp/Fnr family transcriptional regulator [Listeria booriae]